MAPAAFAVLILSVLGITSGDDDSSVGTATITADDDLQPKSIGLIDDEVDLGAFGFDPVTVQGSPVGAAFTPDRRYAHVSNYKMYGDKMYGDGLNPVADDSCDRGDWEDSSRRCESSIPSRRGHLHTTTSEHSPNNRSTISLIPHCLLDWCVEVRHNCCEVTHPTRSCRATAGSSAASSKHWQHCR